MSGMKWTETQKPWDNSQVNQYMDNGSLERSEEKKGVERIFDELMSKHFPNLMENKFTHQ